MIYADYNGTAPLNPEVQNYLAERLTTGPFGNPNAIHSMGQKVLKGMEKCRRLIAHTLGAAPEQIIFNSGASEGIATVFHSLLFGGPAKTGKSIVITSAIEHAAVLNTLKYYEEEWGYQIFSLPVSQQGVVELSVLTDWLETYGPEIALVSVMAANNETGVIQPFEEIGQLCQKQGIKFFCDTTQYIGKLPFHFIEASLDFAVVSGHKLGALTGVGVLLCKDPTQLRPLIHGGGQEQGLRGGTQNYLSIETLAVALHYFEEHQEQATTLEKIKKEFERKIKLTFPEIIIFGDEVARLPGTTLISYPGIHGQAVQIELESHDIFVTTSSACSDNDPTPSQVLEAMGVSNAAARGVIRIGLGLWPEHWDEQYETIYRILKLSYQKLLRLSGP